MFITRRKNSRFWQLDLTFPHGFEFPNHMLAAYFRGRKHFTKSLGTEDRQEALILAAEDVHQFRIAIYLWRKGCAAQKITSELQYADGLHQIEGRQAFVSGREILFLDSAGRPAGKAINPPLLRVHLPLVDDHATAAAFLAFDPTGSQTVLPSKFMPKPQNPDDAIIDAYLDAKPRRMAMVVETRETWSLYKELIGKPLAKATRKDGKTLARHIADKDGAARATVQKKVGWLCAAVNYAISEDLFTGVNPFQGVVSEGIGADEEKRQPLSEEHMHACWANLDTLAPADQLLWRLLAKTGMRLGEAMSIRKEGQERGTKIRFVTVGTKTDASLRRVPLPVDIGLPAEIKGQLFEGTASAASKRLNRFIKDSLADWERGLVVHSLRHRAIDVFRLTSHADPYLRRRLVGHAAVDVHDAYGASGPPMHLLLPMIEANPIDGSFVFQARRRSDQSLAEPALPAA